MDTTLLCMDFTEKSVNSVKTEILYPFGNFSREYYKNFLIAVKSPSQYYYTDIFASFLMNSEDAWSLYYRLLTEQQVDSGKYTEKSILESIPDHLPTLERQFKLFYITAYRNVVKYIECTQDSVKTPIPTPKTPDN